MEMSGCQTGGEDAVEIATFYIGGNWYGVRSSYVVEAIESGNITVIPGIPGWARGCIRYDDQRITIFDLATMLTDKSTGTEGKQIIVIRIPEQRYSFGIVVDELGESAEIPAQRIEPIPGISANSKSLTESFVKPPPEDAEK